MPSTSGGDCLEWAASRRHWRNDATSTTATPNTHIASMARAIGSGMTGSTDPRNTIEAASIAAAAARGDCGNGISLAIAASAANGTRNFTAAANQIQYRTDALLFRNITEKRPAAIAKSVDCQT